MKIEKEIMNDFLWPYKVESIYLKSAENLEMGFKGNFVINQSIYLQKSISSNHFNLVDLIICYNQLAFVGIANGLKKQIFPELSKISYDFFKENFLNSFIYSLDSLKWNKPINSNYFCGEIHIDKIKKLQNTYFLKTSFNFENGVSAKVGLALKL